MVSQAGYGPDGYIRSLKRVTTDLFFKEKA